MVEDFIVGAGSVLCPYFDSDPSVRDLRPFRISNLISLFAVICK